MGASLLALAKSIYYMAKHGYTWQYMAIHGNTW